jgi:tetratricopeptide (TPR) repeat protein
MTRVVLEYHVGDFSQGDIYLERLLEVMRLTAPGPNAEYSGPALVIPLVARIAGVPDRFDIAENSAELVLSSPSVTPIMTNFARQGLALMAVQRGNVVAAQEQYAALQSSRGTIVWYTAGDRLLGLLAQTMGQLDKAAEHFEASLAFCRKAGYRPELAWTCCDYADCLLARARQAAPLPGDRAKAMALLDGALKISSELGMRPLMERVLSRREILQA